MTLVKLRLNHDYRDLSVRFGVSVSTANWIVNSLLPALHAVVFQSVMKEVPSQDQNKDSLPICFLSFTNCRMVIDCTEMKCQGPKNFAKQKKIFSNYKHYTSLKLLLGIGPNGGGVFCSSLYPGSTSDKKIVEHSRVLKHFEAGDLILADKGFLITEMLPTGVSVNLPPILSNGHFTANQILRTRNIARARIHVERFNARFKNYRIVHCIPSVCFKRATMITQTVVGLVNFQNLLIKEVEKYLRKENSDANISCNGEVSE